MQKNNRISEILREFDERFMFHTEQDSGIMVLKVKSMGGHYAGENYGSADIALQYGGPWDPWSNWNADDKPHLQKNAEKYRKQKHRHENTQGAGSSQRISLKEKWLRLWKTRDRLLHRMNRLVWYPALLSTVILGCAIYFSQTLRIEEGLPLTYLYVGATVPVTLLLLRQALDFSYKEELVMDTLTDYVEQMRSWAEEIPAAKKADPVLQEEIVDKITSSIKQTAASGSHFSKMLTPEEEKIMREIIREFMA